MNRITKTLISLLAAVLFFSALPLFPSVTVSADASDDVYTQMRHITIPVNDSKRLEYYLVEPDIEGRFDAVILYCGIGGNVEYEDYLLQYANNWVRSGYIEPVVFIVPIFPRTYAGDDHYEFIRVPIEGKSNLIRLIDSIEDGTCSPKIDTSSHVSVGGFSMGAVAALESGIMYPDRIINVGGFSPAGILFPQAGAGGWHSIENAPNLPLSRDPDAHLFMSCSRTEMDGRCKTSVDLYTELLPNDFTVFFFDSGDHNYLTLYPEIFMFLYFVQHDELPDLQIVSDAENGISPAGQDPDPVIPNPSEPSDPTAPAEPEQPVEPSAATEPTTEPTTAPSTEPTEAPSAEPTAEPTAAPASPSSSAEEGISSFVERLYTISLGRSSDPQGRQDWVDAVTLRGQTGADVARGFLYSDEFLNMEVTNEEFVGILYSTFFDREADAEGSAAWVRVLENGESKEHVIEGFINSTEWANLCLLYGIRSGGTGVPSIEVEPNQATIDFATRLYTTCLNRSADQNGLMAWARQLANQSDTGSGAAGGF
ncbi:MAG: DUF4214 domain-containing protein, partial [Clostridiales bacterium]|nr:DUF4214 domain-containing protein [Clostridiales bacterium]